MATEPKTAEIEAAPSPETSAETSAEKKNPGRRKPAHGKGELLTGGVPGHKGGGGRPPHAYKAFLENRLQTPRAKGQLTRVLNNNNHPAYSSVLGKILPHVLGIPGRARDADPADGPSAVILDL